MFFCFVDERGKLAYVNVNEIAGVKVVLPTLSKSGHHVAIILKNGEVWRTSVEESGIEKFVSILNAFIKDRE